MNIDEYKAEVKKAKERHKKELYQIASDYVMTANPFHVGEVVTDGDNRVLIKKISIDLGMGYEPFPVYIGEALKSNLTSYKNPRTGVIYGNRKVWVVG